VLPPGGRDVKVLIHPNSANHNQQARLIMDHDRISPLQDFLNEFSRQQNLLKESLSQWDSVFQSGLEMVKRLEEICTHTEAKPSLYFLKEVFAYGQGVNFLLEMRVSVLKEIAQQTQEAFEKKHH